MSTTRATSRTPLRSAVWGTGALIAALGLAGCGSVVVASGGSTSGATTGATSGPVATSPSTTTPAPTSTSAGSSTTPGGMGPGGGIATVPATPVRSGPASVVGQVKDGVEPRCLLVGPYVLTGTEALPQAEQDLLTAGSLVAVSGTVDPGMASYCQQGTLLTVTSVHAVRPMGPGPQVTPTVYSTP